MAQVVPGRLVILIKGPICKHKEVVRIFKQRMTMDKQLEIISVKRLLQAKEDFRKELLVQEDRPLLTVKGEIDEVIGSKINSLAVVLTSDQIVE